MNGRLLLCAVLVVAGIVAIYVAVSPDSVVKWNDTAVALHERCVKAWEDLKPTLQPYLNKREIDEERVDDAFQRFEAEVHLSTRELGFLTCPDDPLCKAMQDELIRFIDFQKTLVADLAGLIDEMKAANPPQQEDVDHAYEALEALAGEHKKLHTALQARQRAVAGKFNFELR